MDAYTAFAKVYDSMMDQIPYRDWCRFVSGLLRSRGVEGGLMLELGCGTGTLTELFAAEGFDMIGVDSSEAMLAEAVRKKEKSGSGILYLEQDMRSFELYGTVASAVSLCDSMNYLTSREDLLKVFRLVNNYLDPGGIFIFDLKTDHYFRTTADQIYADADAGYREGTFSYIWEEEYDEEARENNTYLTLFLPERGGLFRRYDEVHTQKVWELSEIRETAEKAGMVFLDAVDGRRKEVTPQTDRIYVILQEKGKKKTLKQTADL
ncbi:MAG: class I SAM-dependent DNA methyltransferase [Lachnospiraceae bacterium]|jgi:SAM-dependent methyltransferase